MTNSKCNCGRKFNCYSKVCIKCLKGKATEEKCPECGSMLKKNGLGDYWCSNLECDYGKE